ncbi:uncharacterized protein LOC134278052 [Saccostrea cucullata]|uniref:uncharacterized protein LOC134278052 n=1 Tax=Saccostrea cuccullata TaxID=36930 RepID=UPI002ED50F66
MNSVPSTTTTSSTTDTVPSTTKTSSTTGVSTSVLQSTTDTVPSTTTTSTRTVGSTSVSTSTTDSVPSTQTTSSTTGSSTSVSTSPSTTLSTAVSSKLASTSATYSVPSTTTSSLKTASSTLVSLSLSTSTPKSSSTVKSSSTDTFTSAHVSSSMSTTNLMKSTTASSVNKGCMCPCERMKNQVIITDKKVLISKIAKMKKELKVNKADLNKQLRKRLSVFDKRASAVAVGTIFGPLLIAFFIGIIVISDIPIMMRHLKYGLCRKAGKKKRKRRIRSDDVRGCPVDVQKDKAGIQEQEMVDNPA